MLFSAVNLYLIYNFNVFTIKEKRKLIEIGEVFFIFWFHKSKVALTPTEPRLIGRIEKVVTKGIDIIGSHFSKDFQICWRCLASLSTYVLWKTILNFSLKYLRCRFLPFLWVLVVQSRGKFVRIPLTCFLSNHQQQRHLEKVFLFAVTSWESALYTVKGYGRIFSLTEQMR